MNGLTGVTRDSLKITIADTSTAVPTTISITRPVEVSLLQEDVLKAVGAVSRESEDPTKRGRRRRAPKTVLSGNRAPAAKMAWLTTLDSYDMPEEIMLAVSPRNRQRGDETEQNEDEVAHLIEEKIERLGSILPPVLEPKTHAEFWHTLLYAEEVQVTYVCVIEPGLGR